MVVNSAVKKLAASSSSMSARKGFRCAMFQMSKQTTLTDLIPCRKSASASMPGTKPAYTGVVVRAAVEIVV